MEGIPITIDSTPKTVWEMPVPIIYEAEKQKYDVFLTTEITQAATYDELCYRLNNASAEEHFHFHLITPGGELDSALRLYDAITNTKAYVTGHLSGSVNSAGTLITMALDDIYVAPFTSFMIHYYSGGVSGKGNELKQRQQFMDNLLESMMFNIYKGFLSNKEIDSLIEGTDIWLSSDEVVARWENMSTKNPVALEKTERGYVYESE
jgi:ATP-dependent protease ClpP protease subunit